MKARFGLRSRDYRAKDGVFYFGIMEDGHFEALKSGNVSVREQNMS